MTTKAVIGMIGAGNMGSAILAGIVKGHRVAVCEADAARGRRLKRQFPIELLDLPELCRRARVLILAVKPQVFEEVLTAIRPHVRKSHVVVSIAAGITTPYIEKRLPPGTRVIRTMPNLPAQVGRGVTGICAGKFATQADTNLARRLFASVGKAVTLDESLIDAVTAVSGSGPAYVFLFLEGWIKASTRLGLSEQLSREMVIETCAGALELLMESGEEASTLRERVTSKGGTTAAALQEFSAAKWEQTIYQAIKAARRRAKELSR
ncbi:MAG: pyrroline-5-carboxylate reductase [Candidatus Omnitrophica bacterium]|nr:pyrroline-5-carboxylate reductase [Candidatus Omnitrophota bacterium]